MMWLIHFTRWIVFCLGLNAWCWWFSFSAATAPNRDARQNEDGGNRYHVLIILYCMSSVSSLSEYLTFGGGDLVWVGKILLWYYSVTLAYLLSIVNTRDGHRYVKFKSMLIAFFPIWIYRFTKNIATVSALGCPENCLLIAKILSKDFRVNYWS